MQSNLVVCVTGEEQADLVEQVSKAIFSSGCQVGDSRLTVISGQTAFLVRVHGDWNNLAKAETALGKVEKRLNAAVTIRRVAAEKTGSELVPYLAEVVGLDQPGVLYHLASFFVERSIGVLELATHSYRAAQTGAPMCSVSLTVGIPANVGLATLREEFFERCDQLNVDAILEPVKG
jgi:glycine cleavage system transcriptional repressor